MISTQPRWEPNGERSPVLLEGRQMHTQRPVELKYTNPAEKCSDTHNIEVKEEKANTLTQPFKRFGLKGLGMVFVGA